MLATACSSAAIDNPVGLGRRLFTEHCAGCHSLSPEVVIVGPSLAGVATRAEATGDARQYIEASILSPASTVVDGFESLMPTDFGAKLAPSEVQALVDFLLTMK